MSRADSRGLYDTLNRRDLFEYGAVFTGDFVRIIIDAELPEVGTRKQFQELIFKEMAAIDYCRNILLGEGKYLKQSAGNYRVLLPSENVSQIDSYISSAMKKLNRSIKLSRNSPKGDCKTMDNRIHKAEIMKASTRRSPGAN